MIEKYYNEKGEVGVVYSPGFGAGWYTWNDIDDEGDSKELVFDKTLVKMILEHKSSEEMKEYVEKKWGNTVYCGGLGACEVAFLPEGTEFVIEEYDGSERIVTKDDTNWFVA